MQKVNYIDLMIKVMIKATNIQKDNKPPSNTESSQIDSETKSTDKPFRFVDALGEWHETTIRSNTAKHNYNWDCLVNDSSGISYNDSQYTIRKGIDVSYYQNDIDWEKVKNAGYDFAIIRIGYRGYGSSGILKEDTAFTKHIEGIG